MTQQLNWNDGSGDKLYLTYDAADGNRVVAVSSDAYTGSNTRTRDVVFETPGGIRKVLTVSQSGKDITIITYNDNAITRNDVAIGYE